MLLVAFFSAESHNKLMNKACLTSLLPLLHLMDIIQTRTRTTFLARFTMMQDRIRGHYFTTLAIPCRQEMCLLSSLSNIIFLLSQVAFRYIHMYAFNSIIIPSSRTLAKTSFCNMYIPTNGYKYLYFSIRSRATKYMHDSFTISLLIYTVYVTFVCQPVCIICFD